MTSWLNTNSHGAGGSTLTTYFPLPFYVTSDARSLFLKNTEVRKEDTVSTCRWLIDDMVSSRLDLVAAHSTRSSTCRSPRAPV